MIIVSLVQPLAAQAVIQGYTTDAELQRGTIVTLKTDDPNSVEPVTVETGDRMHGVVIQNSDAPVTLAAEGDKAFVATLGRFSVLINTQNGPIRPGDYIAASALTGIGMKADAKQQFVLGKAIEAFDGEQGVLGRTEIKDSAGNSLPVAIGLIPVEIRIVRNPLLQAERTSIPLFLRRATEALAGKPVSSARVYASFFIFLVSAGIAASLLYSGVRSGITAIGRNPLSQKSVLRSLLQVIVTSLLVFISGLFAVYLLLKL
jgi:hypothetical protein